MKRLGSLVLVLGLTLSGCGGGGGGGDDGFTDADWDDLHDWCLEHRSLYDFDCGLGVDLVERFVNEESRTEECVVRVMKRTWAAPDYVQGGYFQVRDATKDC